MTAKENELGDLHQLTAKALARAIAAPGHAAGLLLEFGDELPDEVKRFLEKQASEVSPQLLQAASKFLKDNDITAQPDTTDDLSPLKQRLANKNKTRAKVEDVTYN